MHPRHVIMFAGSTEFGCPHVPTKGVFQLGWTCSEVQAPCIWPRSFPSKPKMPGSDGQPRVASPPVRPVVLRVVLVSLIGQESCLVPGWFSKSCEPTDGTIGQDMPKTSDNK